MTRERAGVAWAAVASEGIGRAVADATVAEGMAWLLSAGASRITGHVIAADGGVTAVRSLVE